MSYGSLRKARRELADRGAQELLSFAGSLRAVEELIAAQGDALVEFVGEYCARADREVRYAETNGWTVVRSGSSAHSWAKIRCSGNCPQRSVWSTPASPAAHARQLRAYVDRCPHAPKGRTS